MVRLVSDENPTLECLVMAGDHQPLFHETRMLQPRWETSLILSVHFSALLVGSRQRQRGVLVRDVSEHCRKLLKGFDMLNSMSLCVRNAGTIE